MENYYYYPGKFWQVAKIFGLVPYDLPPYSDFTIGRGYEMCLIQSSTRRDIIGGSVNDNQGRVYWLNIKQVKKYFQPQDTHRERRIKQILNSISH